MAESSTHRQRLPAPSSAKKEANLFGILKNSMGKELSSITMPVEFNEPLSFLQRISEYMEYAPRLLASASASGDALERLQLVSAFAVSALASNRERLRKPFNPLLGETFELRKDDFRLVCEQVSHHPPMSAFHADGEGFVFCGDVHPRLRFWGKSLEIKPEGTLTVQLTRHNEVYTWSNVHCCVHNIVIGKLWFEQYGLMEIHCPSTGLSAQLHFKPAAGWFGGGSGGDLHRVEGFAVDCRTKKKLSFLYGLWTEYLEVASLADYEEHFSSGGGGGDAEEAEKKGYSASRLHVFTRSMTGGSKSPEPPPSPHDTAADPPAADLPAPLHIPGAIRLWGADDRPRDSEKYYNFTSFAMALNEMTPAPPLPRTDSRLRPDIRRLEEGDAEGAAAEKGRLEDKQRESRKERKKKKETWIPRWFKLGKIPHLKNEVWLFNDKYWRREFDECADIF